MWHGDPASRTALCSLRPPFSHPLLRPPPARPVQTYYLRFWSVFGLALAAPFYYVANFTDETRMPMVRGGGSLDPVDWGAC